MIRVYAVLLAALLFNAAANILMKQSALAKGGTSSSIIEKLLSPSGVWFGLGLASFGMALVFYRWALEEINLSIAYPIMTSLGYAIVVLYSYFGFKENLNYKQMIGLLFIIVGVILVSMQSSNPMQGN